jgi:stage V sporulation protein K
MVARAQGGAGPWRSAAPAPAAAPTSVAPAPGPADADAVVAVLAELDALTGLGAAKAYVRELAAFARVQEWRAASGMSREPIAMHMVFRGNPGTGKTTLARLLARLYRGLGLLSRGHLVEVERADLVGEYIGHTAARTRETVRRALGGVLFVDEAYSLCRGGEKDFGREATDVLVKAMEDRRADFALILAGYGAEMDRLLQSNPGLRSRFPVHLDFPDYTVDQLLQIAEAMVTQRGYRLAAAARQRVMEILRAPGARAVLSTGNARLVRNLIERALRRQAIRLVRAVDAGGLCPPPPSSLADLLAEDFDVSLRALAGLCGPSVAPLAAEAGIPLERLARTPWQQGMHAPWATAVAPVAAAE